jgi:hypothetical protein
MKQENTLKLMTIDRKPGWSFYITWVLLTTVAIPVAFVIDLFLLRIVTSVIGDYIYVNGVQHITEDYLAMYFLVPTMGLLTGAVQYGMLRRLLPRMGWWVVATLGGWLLGTLLIVLFTRLQWMGPFNLAPMLLLIGAAIGFTQWLVLRRRLPAAGWWIAANLLGWGVLGLLNQGSSFDQFTLILIGLIPACATAAALALLANQAPGEIHSPG